MLLGEGNISASSQEGFVTSAPDTGTGVSLPGPSKPSAAADINHSSHQVPSAKCEKGIGMS